VVTGVQSLDHKWPVEGTEGHRLSLPIPVKTRAWGRTETAMRVWSPSCIEALWACKVPQDVAGPLDLAV